MRALPELPSDMKKMRHEQSPEMPEIPSPKPQPLLSREGLAMWDPAIESGASLPQDRNPEPLLVTSDDPACRSWTSTLDMPADLLTLADGVSIDGAPEGGGSDFDWFGLLPRHASLEDCHPAGLRRIARAAENLRGKLLALDSANQPLSEYTQRYLGDSLNHRDDLLGTYTWLMGLALGPEETDCEMLTVLDYGGGTGLLSLLAKEAGFREVIYNDIYDVSCHDARVLARSLGLEADRYVCGDARDLRDDARREGWKANVLLSFDVIEHIYDVDTFLGMLPAFGPPSYSVVLASSANGFNPRTRQLTMRLHRRRETRNKSKKWGYKRRDSLESFRSLRRQMIRLIDPQISERELKTLALRTRGLAGKDILRAVERDRNTGRLPRPRHATNTCDPRTGNWSEQLLNPFQLARKLTAHGFRAGVRGGYYPDYEKRLKRRFTSLLNRSIARAPQLGLLVAPYYVVLGRKS